jgi:hypothetical protein
MKLMSWSLILTNLSTLSKFFARIMRVLVRVSCLRTTTMEQKTIFQMFGTSSATVPKKQKTAEAEDLPFAAAEVPDSKLFGFLHDPSWRAALAPEFQKPYIACEREGQGVSPRAPNVRCPQRYSAQSGARVYHWPGPVPRCGTSNGDGIQCTPWCRCPIVTEEHLQGNRCCRQFSFGVVVEGVLIQELESNIKGFKSPNHGDLSAWSTRGVLLLNTSLTVREAAPGSHAKQVCFSNCQKLLAMF